ncbi:MAG: S41 family peptidase [Gemmataceae bacterium]
MLRSTIILAIFAAPAFAADGNLTGTVRDADGKPIPGATVSINHVEGNGKRFRYSNPTKAGADGVYRITFAFDDGAAVKIKRLVVSGKGFIQFDDRMLDGVDVISLTPGLTVTRDFTLARGEPLAGVVDAPPTAAERKQNVPPERRQFEFVVSGPSFKQLYATEPGGAFEIAVPAGGKYDLELLGRQNAVLKGVPAGSRGLKLVQTFPTLGPDVLGAAFDALWADMDRHYSYFQLKKIDWAALKARYRGKVVAAGNEAAFIVALEEMLAELKDMHVWIDAAGERVQPFSTPVVPNVNRNVVLASLTDVQVCGNEFAVVGRTKGDGFATFVMARQSNADERGVKQVVDFLRVSRDAPGFIVDLRNANGGNEAFAADIARMFCAKPVVYAKSRYRAGPKHTDLTPGFERELKPVPDPITKPVVCLLGPGAVSSGEGFAKMMKALPTVTTVGLPTRGSSGNPKPFKLPALDMSVYYSRWVDLQPDGTPVEGVGVKPAIVVEATPDEYRRGDPTWNRGIAVLREKVR